MADTPAPDALMLLKRVSNRLYDDAKRWWGISIALKMLIFLVGVVAVVIPAWSKPLPFVVGSLILASELATLYTEHLGGTSQGLRRKFDLMDSFGEGVSSNELADLAAKFPKHVGEGGGGSDSPVDRYFVSYLDPGDARAAENVLESSWWSKHLAARMALIYSAVSTVTVIGSLASLVAALVAVNRQETAVAVARVVTSTLLLLFSLGFVKYIKGYHDFSRKCGQVEQKATAMLKKSRIKPGESVWLWYEYHLARAVAPMIPTWLWSGRRASMNESFEMVRNDLYRLPKAPGGGSPKQFLS